MKIRFSLLCAAVLGMSLLTGCMQNGSVSSTVSRVNSAVSSTVSRVESGISSVGSGVSSWLSSGAGSGSPSGTNSGTNSGTGSLLPDSQLSLQEMYDRLQESYGDYRLPGRMLEKDDLDTMFSISPDWVEDFVADRADSDVAPDTLVIVRAKDNYATQIEDALNMHRDALIDAVGNGTGKEKINASKVYTQGPYVFFVMLGDVDEDTFSGEDLAGAYAEQVNRGMDTILDFFKGRRM